MAPLKGELGAKRSEGLSPKGLTSCVNRIRISCRFVNDVLQIREGL